MSDNDQLIMMDRDPKELNIQNEAHFHDVFGEPDHVSSLSCSWRITKKIFTTTHQKFYLILSTILGLPIAFLWGLYYAIVSFFAIWFCYPTVLSVRHILYYVKQLYSLFVRCFLDPWYESLSLMLSNIHVTVTSRTPLPTHTGPKE